jgi:hypothetical protein
MLIAGMPFDDFRVPRQSAIVHVDPWSSGERRICDFQLFPRTKSPVRRRISSASTLHRKGTNNVAWHYQPSHNSSDLLSGPLLGYVSAGRMAYQNDHTDRYRHPRSNLSAATPVIVTYMVMPNWMRRLRSAPARSHLRQTCETLACPLLTQSGHLRCGPNKKPRTRPGL